MSSRTAQKAIVVLALLCAAPFSAMPQNSASTSSPFSRFGLGELQPQLFGQNRALGGTGYGTRTRNQVNVANPAALTAFSPNAAIFDLGLNGGLSRYESGGQSHQVYQTNISHLVMGFKLSERLSASMGMLPYSSVGYAAQETKSLVDLGSPGSLTSRFAGQGGTNSYFMAAGYKLLRGRGLPGQPEAGQPAPDKSVRHELSAGLTAGYLYGSLDQVFTSQYQGEDVLNTVRTTRRDILSGFQYTGGFQYTLDFERRDKERVSLTLGAALRTSATLGSEASELVYGSLRVNTSSGGNRVLEDTLSPLSVSQSQVELPTHLGAGASVRVGNRLLVAVDYELQDWSRARFGGQANADLGPSSRLSAGIQYVPQWNAVTSYLKVVRYRAGFHMSQTYWRMEGQAVQDMAFSLGLGLPMRNSRTFINLFAELGQMAPAEGDLLTERYVNGGVSFSLQDIWFIKRRFD